MFDAGGFAGPAIEPIRLELATYARASWTWTQLEHGNRVIFVTSKMHSRGVEGCWHCPSASTWFTCEGHIDTNVERRPDR